MKKIIFGLFIAVMLISSSVKANEVIFLRCEYPEFVNAKTVSIETLGGNEYLSLIKNNGSRFTLLRTYNPQVEKYTGITDVDDHFYQYEYISCEFKFEGFNNTRVGTFFINKK